MTLKPIERITDAIENYFIEKATPAKILNAYYSKTQSKANWRKQATTLQKKEIKDFKMAIITATDPLNPRRGSLMRFYQSYMTDLHLGSCIDSRILPVQCATFKLVDKDNNEDLEAHKLLEKPWFVDLVKKVCTTTFEGTKLLELFDLNERGELKQVGEIPMSNFLPSTGIVINEEWDTNGISYREGVYKDFYVQIGGDDELGMFVELAVIILAKKLGLGSWISYIEKLGIPPVFVTTDRMDQNRLDELFEMMTEFKSNFFTILQGNEKIEIPNAGSPDAYNSFKSLFSDVCNTELSKRILGGTGVLDEKSFVGAAEVHERMLGLRNKVDKLLFKFYFNEEIKPRLVKLSPVYAPLENLYFEFDDTESLTLKDLIQAVKDLSGDYEFDVEELVRLTGLPITKLKEITATKPTDPAQPTQKKKPNASVDRQFTFAPYAKSNWSVFAATWDAAIDRLATQIYNGEVKPAELDKDLVLKNYAAFNKAAELAWGDSYYSNDLTRKFRNDMMKFSGSKAYNLMAELDALRSQKMMKNLFIEKAKSIITKHNEAWLNTEAKFIANSTSTAKDFEQFVKDIDIYPNLKLRTMEDDAVRETHRLYDGIVKPVNEWKVTPPFDHGCRCFLEQTTDPVTGGVNISKKDRFSDNPAISGTYFSDINPYYENTPKNQRTMVSDNMNAMKQFTPYNRVEKTKGDNSIYVSDFYDMKDFDANLTAATKVADHLNKDIYIRPHVETSGVKNPEYGIGKPNELGDLKTYEPIVNGKSVVVDSFLKNNLSSASKQKCKYVILDLTSTKDTDFKDKVPNKLRGELSDKYGYKPTIKNVVIIRGNKVGILTRSEINGSNIEELFNNLFK